MDNRPLVTELLLSSGADPNLRDNFEKSALDYAEEKEHHIIAKILKQH